MQDLFNPLDDMKNIPHQKDKLESSQTKDNSISSKIQNPKKKFLCEKCNKLFDFYLNKYQSFL